MTGKRKRDEKAEAAGLSFEESLARLGEIADKLEGGDLPLEEAIALAQEGIKLSQVCEQQLTAAEGKIQQLVERMGAIGVEPSELETSEGED